MLEFLPLIIVVAIVVLVYRAVQKRKATNADLLSNMSIGRLLSWAVVVVTALIPLNWLRLWIIGDIPKDVTPWSFLIGILILWGISAALGYFLIGSARGARMRKAKDEKEMQELLVQPLTEIKPSQALLKPGEKAYGSVIANLQEVKSVGFSAGTTGMSFRVAKGLSIRSSGTRGHIVKGVVCTATGELVVTDQRIIFAGDRKSFSIPIAKLLNVTNYTNGFGFHDNKSTYTLTTDSDKGRVTFGAALNKVLDGQPS